MSAEGHASAGEAGKLVAMANQIGFFFMAQRGGHAAADIAAHLRRFWTPGMRAAIVAHVAAGGLGLSDAAAAAIRILAEGSAPAIMTKT
jgi:formate dehydrogenase subunit delta